MKLKLIALLAVSIFSISSVYADPAADKKKDEEALGTLIVLDKNEITAANLADSKKVSPQVKDFANMMKKDHGKNLADTKQLANKLGKPIENSDAKSLAKDGADELKSLKSLKGDDFAKAYVDDMVKDHEAALNKIDDLIKDANNADVKKHLEATRDAVQHHLDMAKDLQSNLSKA